MQLISTEQANLLIPSATPAALDKAVAAATKAAASAAAALATESYSSLILQNIAQGAEDPDLKDEVAEEVSKYEKLTTIDVTVEKDSAEATIVLKYASPSEAARAHAALQGRAFANKKIIATLAP